MIGVIARPDQAALVEEFFQLFKTPWERFVPGRAYDVVLATVDDLPDVDARLVVIGGAGEKSSDAGYAVRRSSTRRGGRLDYRGSQLPIYGELATFRDDGSGTTMVAAEGASAGLRFDGDRSTTIRLGYDPFDEAGHLLSFGQPVEWASVPTLDLHILLLRESMLEAGLILVEIAPAPAGHRFIAALTHDIDFIGIRRHLFDHTMWGFVYRSTFGAIGNLFRRRCTARRLIRIWRALAALPFVYLGWAKDFWSPFAWYLRVEKDLPATYFLIPFKGRSGARVAGRHASRRAAAYDATDIPEWTSALLKAGCEVGVHGIDAWHSVDSGRAELARISDATGQPVAGIRMHWLLRDEDTFRVLDQAGYGYDSTAGYNETIGFRNGTAQVFRPAKAGTLLELPLHIQDGALFYPGRLDLPETEAWPRCLDVIRNAERFGGVLTVLWHDRSHGPERFWGEFYERLVLALKRRKVWFATAAQTVRWFRQRRGVRFERVESGRGDTHVRLRGGGEKIHPPLQVLVRRMSAVVKEVAWSGESPLELLVEEETVFAPALCGSTPG